MCLCCVDWASAHLAIAYNERGRAGDGCTVPHDESGAVTLYGKQVIDALHQYGVILDLSHTSEKTALSAIEYSQTSAPEKPVIYSHSNPSARVRHVSLDQR